MSSSDDSWNVSKHRTKSEDKSCLYKQTFNINPLMGGFSTLGETLDTSVFNVYQFTGQYKVGASNNNVVLTTTSSCSQASVSFIRALVVFQQKVEPDKRDTATRCKQLVEFNENKYTIVVSPFEQHEIDVGTMITASNGTISYTTFKLPSKTNQTKIAQALFDYLNESAAPPKVSTSQVDIKEKTKVEVKQTPSPPPPPMLLTGVFKVSTMVTRGDANTTSLPPFDMQVYDVSTGIQKVKLLPPSSMPAGVTFNGFNVIVVNNGNYVKIEDGFYPIYSGLSYKIGYSYTSSTIIDGFYGSPFDTPIKVGASTVVPVPVYSPMG